VTKRRTVRGRSDHAGVDPETARSAADHVTEGTASGAGPRVERGRSSQSPRRAGNNSLQVGVWFIVWDLNTKQFFSCDINKTDLFT